MNNDSGRNHHKKYLLRILLLTKKIGPVIGRHGIKLKALKERFDVDVKISPTRHEKVVTFSGSSAVNVAQCTTELLKEYLQTDDYATEATVNVLIPQSQVGGVIGKNGIIIKDIRETSGAYAGFMGGATMPGSTDREMTVDGSLSSIRTFLDLVLEKLQEVPLGYSIEYNPDYEGWNSSAAQIPVGRGMRGRGVRGGPGRGTGRGGGQGGWIFEAEDGNADNENEKNKTDNLEPGNTGQLGGNEYGKQSKETTQVTIPNDLADAIIDKGGEMIRQIKQRSLAEITIEEPAPGCGDRVITITGEPYSVNFARFLLQQSVRMYSGKN